MKSVTRLFIIAITALAAVLFISNAAMAGIADTVHNLSSSNNTSSAIHATSGQQNDQICIWCHTPHQANAKFAGAPLWNKGTINKSFTMYGTTMANTSTAASPNAVSLACLSCHDGANAINSIVNQARSGGWTSGYDVAFGSTTAGNAFVMPDGVDNIGTDLTNDHPISITYGPVETTAGMGGLNLTSKDLDSGFVVIGNPSGTGTIADLLFNDGGTGAKDQVECASCHDPHSSKYTEFLRIGSAAGIGNANSDLCLTCHDK